MRKILIIVISLFLGGCDDCLVSCREYDYLKSQNEELESQVEELEFRVEEFEEDNSRLTEIIENAVYEFQNGNYRNGMGYLYEL